MNLDTTAPLPSLTQQARRKRLGTARGILIFVGVVNTLLALLLFFSSDALATRMLKRPEFRQQIELIVADQEDDDADVDNDAARLVAMLSLTRRMIHIGVAILGVIGIAYLALAGLIYRVPLFSTVTGLLIYAGCMLTSCVVNPLVLTNPIAIVLMIIFLAALYRGVRAALAFRRFEREVAPRLASLRPV